MDDGLTEVQVAAIRAACAQLTVAQLHDLRRPSPDGHGRAGCCGRDNGQLP